MPEFDDAATPLATVAELQSRLFETMSEGEVREATGALETLSDDARIYGSRAWTTPDNTPELVRRKVLAAAKRYMGNFAGHTTDRAADEALGHPDLGDEAGTPHFNLRERRELREIAALYEPSATTEFHSVAAYAWNPSEHVRGCIGAPSPGHGACFANLTTDGTPSPIPSDWR